MVVTLEDGKTFEGDVMLVAVGRGPLTQNMGFEEVGVTMDRGFVTTNERLATNVRTCTPSATSSRACSSRHRGFQQGIFVARRSPV